MANKINHSSDYIEEQRKSFSLYVMQSRAIPAITDGLKAGARRVLWTARDGKKNKSASLAGATMPIHPHASPESAIDTITAPFCNNIPLFKGDGAFGTLLEPTEYGASRYTSVTVSKFTQDVIFKDLEIIPLTDNYDGTLEDPVHFLPLIPTVLLNPAEGIAVGFATNILPRCLKDIISVQIAHLKGEKYSNALIPTFYPTDNKSNRQEQTERGIAYYFKGTCTKKDKNIANISKLPYGLLHSKLIKKLDELSESGTIVEFTDKSRDTINIDVKFKPSVFKDIDEDSLIKMFGLEVRHFENLNVLDFSGQYILSVTAEQIIKQFTDWRLEWYVKRYERLRDLLAIDIQRYLDVQTAIKNNVGGLAKSISSRADLKLKLTDFGIVYIDYIADLPVYRFTEEERIKNEKKIQDANKLMDEYTQLLTSDKKRAKVYINELEHILDNYNKGVYNGK